MKVLDNDQWVSQQFSECELGDARRTNRLLTVAGNMLARPEASLVAQNVEWADVKAAYRFFDNSAVTFDAVAEQHWQQTRNTKTGRYLLICDTTDIDHYSHQATTGLGILGDGKGRGMQLHNCLMYDSKEKQICGSPGGLIYYRKHSPEKETRAQRLARTRESDMWGNLVDKIGRAPEGSQWIHVFDRGGDNFEAMCHIRLSGNDWVIRAAQLNRTVIVEDDKSIPLSKAIEQATILGSYELNLRSREGVPARVAKLELSVVKVTYPRPKLFSKWVKGCGIKELSMNVVIVQETDAPKGVTPIFWVLLTSLSVETFEDAWQVVEDYENRWLIEEHNKVIKTACSIEKHALRTAERLEPLIGLISVIGMRLFQLKLVGRNQPEAKAATHIPTSWLKCLKLARPKLMLTGLTVYEFFRELAKLGGFLGRKGDGEPGWQTIWRGFQKMQLLLDGMRLAGAF
ncbi:MAG: IS4 family transposase [Aureliella sp.]